MFIVYLYDGNTKQCYTSFPNIQCYHLSSLKLAMMEVFTPWKSANAANLCPVSPLPPESWFVKHILAYDCSASSPEKSVVGNRNKYFLNSPQVIPQNRQALI